MRSDRDRKENIRWTYTVHYIGDWTARKRDRVEQYNIITSLNYMFTEESNKKLF